MLHVSCVSDAIVVSSDCQNPDHEVVTKTAHGYEVRFGDSTLNIFLERKEGTHSCCVVASGASGLRLLLPVVTHAADSVCAALQKVLTESSIFPDAAPRMVQSVSVADARFLQDAMAMYAVNEACTHGISFEEALALLRGAVNNLVRVAGGGASRPTVNLDGFYDWLAFTGLTNHIDIMGTLDVPEPDQAFIKCYEVATAVLDDFVEQAISWGNNSSSYLTFEDCVPDVYSGLPWGPGNDRAASMMLYHPTIGRVHRKVFALTKYDLVTSIKKEISGEE